MKQNQLRIILIAAVIVLAVSMVAVGCLIGNRMATVTDETTALTTSVSADNPSFPEESAVSEESMVQLETAVPDEVPTDPLPPAEDPTPSLTILRVAVAAETDPNDQEKLVAALDTFAEGFASSNPGYAVEFVYGKDIPATVTGKDGFDLILCSANEMTGYVSDQTIELSALVSEYGQDWLGAALALGRFGRKSDEQLFIPFCYDRAVLYADKAVFETLNVALPTGEMTLDQYESLIVNLTRKTDAGDLYVGVYMPYYEARVWMMYCRGLGEGPIVNGELKLSSGKNYEALSHMLLTLEYGYARSWKYAAYGSDNATCAMSLAYACNPAQDDRYVLTTGELEADPGKNADVLLAEGRLVMLPLPTFDGQYCGTANSAASYGFAVVADTQKATAAESLILYAMGSEGQRLLNVAYGGIPVNKTLWGEDFWRVGYLACEGSENVLVGIESDGTDNLYALLKTSGKTEFGDYYYTATRLDTLEWLYFYERIGNADHTVANYAQVWLIEFDTEANKLIRTRG